MLAASKRFALLVSGSPLGAAPELLWQLAEGMSLVVAVDSGARWCFAAGLIPDLLVGDMDSVDPEARAAFAAQEVEELTFPSAKDASDLELALEAVIARGYSDLVATNVLGARLDHELAALGALSAAGTHGLAVTVVEPSQTLVFMNNPGARSQLRLDLGADLSLTDAPPVSLVPWAGLATVSASGFVWELDHAVLDPAHSLWLSNLPAADSPRIELHSGALIVTIQVPSY